MDSSGRWRGSSGGMARQYVPSYPVARLVATGLHRIDLLQVSDARWDAFACQAAHGMIEKKSAEWPVSHRLCDFSLT